jgi:hypothetical protein
LFNTRKAAASSRGGCTEFAHLQSDIFVQQKPACDPRYDPNRLTNIKGENEDGSKEEECCQFFSFHFSLRYSSPGVTDKRRIWLPLY